MGRGGPLIVSERCRESTCANRSPFLKLLKTICKIEKPMLAAHFSGVDLHEPQWTLNSGNGKRGVAMGLSPQARFHLPPVLPRLLLVALPVGLDAIRPTPPRMPHSLIPYPGSTSPSFPSPLPSHELRGSFKRAPRGHQDSQRTTKTAQKRPETSLKKPQELCPTKKPVGT